jgi:hypothetical protein
MRPGVGVLRARWAFGFG